MHLNTPHSYKKMSIHKKNNIDWPVSYLLLFIIEIIGQSKRNILNQINEKK